MARSYSIFREADMSENEWNEVGEGAQVHARGDHEGFGTPN
jgi:hypothetical protein